MEEFYDLPDSIVCPSCGCCAYLDGDVYCCDQCGWSIDADAFENEEDD